MTELLYKIGEFEYKLDILIEDIRLNKISIYNVDIANIVAQFNTILKEPGIELVLGDLTFFYRNTAELLYIKIIRLLPVKDSGYDDNEEKLLQEQVINALEKLKFSQYSSLLIQYRETHSVDFNRFAFPFRIPFSDEDILSDVRLNDLSRTYINLLKNAKDDEISFTFNKKVSVKQKMALLLELFEKSDRILFTDLIVDLTSREHITSAFQAILQAIYDGICTYEQESIYADIYLIKTKQDLSNIRPSDIDNEYEELIRQHFESLEDDKDDFSIVDSEDS